MRPKAPSRDFCPALLSLAVHELRTPATVVAGYIRMLLRLRGDTLTDEQRKFVQGAERSCDRLTALLAELGDLSNLAAGTVTFRRQEVALFRLAEEVAADLPVPDDRGALLDVRGAGVEADIIGDPDWLRLALRGLLSAPLGERAERGVLVVQCALQREASRSLAVVGAGDEDAVASLLRTTPSRWGPVDQFRGGLGFALPVAGLLIEAHGGRVGSPRGPNSRAAVAVALPLKRRPPRTTSARRGT
jgi:light-regulated signal transduction histidine kinase (bacteriophytochrome)